MQRKAKSHNCVKRKYSQNKDHKTEKVSKINNKILQKERGMLKDAM